MRVNLRHIGIGAFLASIALASCGGGGSTSGVASNPTGLIPSSTPSGPTPTPTPIGPTPTPSPTPSGVPTPSPTVSGAVAGIDFTGSFQFGTFNIQLYSNGVAVVTQSTGQSRQLVPRAITGKFFSDLAQNLPVDDILVGTCTKPTAPPTDETLVTYQALTSPDISCYGNHVKTKQLYDDVLTVENALNLRSFVRFRRT
jgi:hypothetical protein